MRKGTRTGPRSRDGSGVAAEGLMASLSLVSVDSWRLCFEINRRETPVCRGRLDGRANNVFPALGLEVGDCSHRCTGAVASSKAGCWLWAPEVNVLSCNPSVIPLVRRDALFTLRHGFPRRPGRHVAQAARESDREKEGGGVSRGIILQSCVQASVFTHGASSIKIGTQHTLVSNVAAHLFQYT